MREIKFRAWDKKRKEMWYPEDMTHGKMVDPDNCGSLIYCDIEQLALGADGTIYILDECGNFENAVAIGENYELMQFTGLKDSKGKEIYEGDIVMIYDARESESFPMFSEKVIFEKGKFMTEGEFDLYDTDNYSYELIGNIFENKELLK